jgi:alpha-glucuronidase
LDFKGVANMEPWIKDFEYQCWLKYEKVRDAELLQRYRSWCGNLLLATEETAMIRSAKEELLYAVGNLLDMEPSVTAVPRADRLILAGQFGSHALIEAAITPAETGKAGREGYLIKTVRQPGQEYIVIAAASDQGILYGVYEFLSLLQTGREIDALNIVAAPANPLRMVNHWDNLDGTVERGYAGKSIFYEQDQLTANQSRIRDYARLLASVGINGIVINNVNVHREETRLITDKLDVAAKIAAIFRNYGIKVFLSINYAAPLELGDLDTADPLDEGVGKWWRKKAGEIYRIIPDLGGFLVKADSEHRPGPFTYRRNHAEGANMLAKAVEPYGGLVIWRCFVYNCTQDWRDRITDRAKAAYDNFNSLDGEFAANVILQIKNGPMDFQVREPVSPLFGALKKTNQMLELQITQEYTGQQIDLCYLAPQWKEILEFDTCAQGQGSAVKRIVDGSLFGWKYCGFAGVANIGADLNWTGHIMAQANLYGFARLAWNPDRDVDRFTAAWVRRTFGNDPEVVTVVTRMLAESWRSYEKYTAPLGIGWMVNPGHHYGPNVDGYEYSRWGTYHRADCHGIGIDRSVRTGTGYAGQYYPGNASKYETPGTCPDELLLFFHHLPYTYRLKSGKTVIQHIYDTHFDGVEQVRELQQSWERLKSKIDTRRFEAVRERLGQQLENAIEWRDIINAYFYRKTGIPDQHGRKIY